MADTILRVNDIHRSFDGAGVLRGVSMESRDGEVVVIVGPSGCGKSTLLRCINGLEAIDKGEIWLRDEKISGRVKDLHVVRQKIGMVFQSYDLFPHMKVMDNLLLGPTKALGKPKQEVEQEALHMLERVGLKEKAHVYPRTLSGGQKQRVAIAGVMAMRPRCIILDEATAMLDPQGRREVLQTIRRLNRELKITVLLITHYMEETVEADRILVLDRGRLCLCGTPREVFSQADRLREMGLTLPAATQLAERLREGGLPLPAGILTCDELAEALFFLKAGKEPPCR